MVARSVKTAKLQIKGCGLEKGETITDVEANFEDIERASQHHPLEDICSISEYGPELIEDMITFVKKLKMKLWVWPDWIDQYRQSDPKRIRLIARVDSQLVACIDSMISPNGMAGINYISVLHDHRHRGIGSVLVREAAKLLKQRGAKSMFAGWVPRSFYEANGWRLKREYIGMTGQLSELS